MNFVRLAQLDFLPRSADCGLFVLRVWLGLSILILHGWGKLVTFSEKSGSFPDPLGVGSKASLAMLLFGEVVCAALLAAGLFTRFAAAVLSFAMGVAFFIQHKGALSGPGSGELAFIYLAGFVALFVAGAGKFSVDEKLGKG
jgi:putative oxidoreductase